MALLQCLAVMVTDVSSASKALWVVMYTMNNHTYNARWRLAKHCIKVVLDTTQSLLEMLVGLLKKCYCHKKPAVDAWDVLQVARM